MLLADNSLFPCEILEAPFKHIISKHPSWNLIKFYLDKGNEHSAFDCFIEDCKIKQIDLILTQSISRFSNNLMKTLETIKCLNESGIGVYFMIEDLYTLNPMYKMFIQLVDSFVQYESLHKTPRICTHCPNIYGSYSSTEDVRKPDDK